jgi:hypothetical protein
MLTESRCEVPRQSYAGVYMRYSTSHEDWALLCLGTSQRLSAAEFTLLENHVYTARYDQQVK